MKSYVIKIVFFIGVIFLSQVVIGTLWQSESEERNKVDADFRAPVDVYYFGDSTLWFTHRKDKDKRPIHKLLSALLPEVRIKVCSRAAYQLDVFESFCRYMVMKEKPGLPRLVIIPINLRSFSPQWDLKPAYQFVKERIRLEGGLLSHFYRPLRALKYDFGILTEREHFSTPIYWRNRVLGPLSKMVGLKRAYICRYLYPLTKEHRKMKALDHIAHLLPVYGITPVFYVTPVDWEEGENRLPGEFKAGMAKNIDVIRSVLRNRGHDLQDLSTALGTGLFAWRNKTNTSKPNEHMNQVGRLYVAKQLAQLVKKKLALLDKQDKR